MAVLKKVSGAAAALDAAVAALSAGNNKDTMTKIATYLKNRRGVLSEIVNSKDDPTDYTFATNDGTAGATGPWGSADASGSKHDVQVFDHL